MDQRVLITGADRGLGLALTRDFLERGDTVFAGQFMEDWPKLKELEQAYQGKLFLIPLDVSSPESIGRAYRMVKEQTDRIDLLINNAGISGSVGDITCLENMERGMQIFWTNCLGPLCMVNTFLPLIEKEKGARRLCFISSEAGSVSVCHRSDGFVYPMSKTGLNMAVRLLFEELKERGFTFRLYNPGWMKSYMSGKKSVVGKIEPEESSKVAVELFTQPLKHEDVLKMFDNDHMVWPF